MPTLHHWLTAEPFTLTMSAGFFGFFAHAGVLAALEEAGLAPQAVTGSSSGALVTAAWAAGRGAAELRERLLALERADFWDPAPGLGLLRGRLMRQQLADLLGVADMRDCRVPVALSVYDARARQTVVWRTGSLVEAVYASCAFPFLMQPLVKDGRLYWDGGILDRPGLAGTAAGERVLYHHIASRSPWRGQKSDALRLPQRPNTASLALHNLPRSGPSKLHTGPRIYALAREGALRALELPLDGGE